MDNGNKEGKHLMTTFIQAVKAAKEWCARATPYIEYLQQQEKYYIERVRDLLCEDIYQPCLSLNQCQPSLK